MTIFVVVTFLLLTGALLLSVLARAGRPSPARTLAEPDLEPWPDEASTEMVDEGQPPRSNGVSFELGCTYTRAQIHAELGGGMQDYLPHVAGVVVCGCFNPALNPDAPDVILPGFGPGIERWAEAFARQRSAVPCFLKRATNVWEYVGRFRVRELSREPAEVERWAAAAKRVGEVSMVLHLEEADE